MVQLQLQKGMYVNYILRIVVHMQINHAIAANSIYIQASKLALAT